MDERINENILLGRGLVLALTHLYFKMGGPDIILGKFDTPIYNEIKYKIVHPFVSKMLIAICFNENASYLPIP